MLGPIDKQRWIYSCSKQLMDRVIWAYGSMGQLDFTLFRPFNWIGAGLDSIHTAKEGSSRVITQFLGHIVRGEPIKLVDGGAQKRAFTYIDDGIDALMRIIENQDGVATGKIYNIGNPANNFSVRELATMMLELAEGLPGVPRQRGPGAHHRGELRRLLRQGLPGRAEPRPEDRQHHAGPRLGAEGRHGHGARAASSTPIARRSTTRAHSPREDLMEKPVVGVVMGSQSDWDVMQHAAKVLKDFGVAFETKVVSAHRTPDAMFDYAESARDRGLRCIVAGAGGAAHLPGMIASKTTLPVLGVPVPSRHLAGQDSLYSIVQMPKGIPVATFAIGEAGAANAGLFAVSLLAGTDAGLAAKLAAYREELREMVAAMQLPDVL